MAFNQFTLLKTRRFLPLFATQFLGAFHDNLFKNALVVLILYGTTTQTDISPEILVTMATGIFILPFILFSAMGGQLADKHPKHEVIHIIKLAEIGIAVLGFASLLSGSLALSFLTLFALGTQSAFFGPSKYSILPEHLEDYELIGGNALVNTGTFMAILIGTIAGTLLVTLPAGKIIVGGSLLLIAVAGYLTSRAIPEKPATLSALYIKLNPFRGTIDNIKRTFSQSREIVYAVLGTGWFYFLGALFLAQFPNYTKLVLGGDERVLALFMVLFSIGIGIGGLLNNRLLHAEISMRFTHLAALGISLFTFDLYWASLPFAAAPAHDMLVSVHEFITTPTGIRIAFDIFMVSVCGGLFVVPLFAMIQHRAENEMRARIVAGNAIADSFFILMSAVLCAMLLAAGVTILQLFLIFGIGNIGVAFGYWRHRKGKPTKPSEIL